MNVCKRCTTQFKLASRLQRNTCTVLHSFTKSSLTSPCWYHKLKCTTIIDFLDHKSTELCVGVGSPTHNKATHHAQHFWGSIYYLHSLYCWIHLDYRHLLFHMVKEFSTFLSPMMLSPSMTSLYPKRLFIASRMSRMFSKVMGSSVSSLNPNFSCSVPTLCHHTLTIHITTHLLPDHCWIGI